MDPDSDVLQPLADLGRSEGFKPKIPPVDIFIAVARIEIPG
jgi:hypothetical protein